MAAAEVLISRTEVDPSQLGKVPLPTGISRKVFESVANMMITVTGDEGHWHGQISACVSDPSFLEEKTTPCKKATAAIRGIVSEKYTYPVANTILDDFKAELRDAIAWDGAHVVGPTGTIIGVNRKLDSPSCSYMLKGGFGTKHNSALAFAYHFQAVVIVRSDDEEKGITILSNAALRRSSPEAFKLVPSRGGGSSGDMAAMEERMAAMQLRMEQAEQRAERTAATVAGLRGKKLSVGQVVDCHGLSDLICTQDSISSGCFGNIFNGRGRKSNQWKR